MKYLTEYRNAGMMLSLLKAEKAAIFRAAEMQDRPPSVFARLAAVREAERVIKEEEK